jgi:hypothetical protein
MPQRTAAAFSLSIRATCCWLDWATPALVSVYRAYLDGSSLTTECLSNLNDFNRLAVSRWIG